MFDEYRNIYLNNSMNGSEKGYQVCSCGYISTEKHIYSHCPNCNIQVTKYDNTICFGKINFINNNCNIIELDKEKQEYYKFAIIHSYKKGTYEIDFDNKKIKNINVIENKNIAIIFNGHEKIENMIKFFNIDTQEYIEEEEFRKQIIESRCYYYLYKNKNIVIKHDLHFGEIQEISELKRLAKWCAQEKNELFIKSGLDPYKLNQYVKYPNETTPSKKIGVSKYVLKLIKKYGDNTSKIDAIMFLSNELNANEIIQFVDNFVSKEDSWLFISNAREAISLYKRANISFAKLSNYLYKELPLNQFLYYKSDENMFDSPIDNCSILYDCYRMANSLNINFEKYPKHLEQYHKTLIYEFNLHREECENECLLEVSNQFENLIMQDDKFALIIPKTKKELFKEGKRMHHCVGTYVESMANGRSIIFFLRKQNDIDNSYVTIEYSPYDNAIKQVKAKYNEHAKDDVIEFVKKWAKEKNINIHSLY